MSDVYDPMIDRLDQVNSNLIDVETAVNKTNELLSQVLAIPNWQYLHAWREAQGIYRWALSGMEDSSTVIEANGDVDLWQELGLKGWELVQVYVDTTINYLFKRKLVS